MREIKFRAWNIVIKTMIDLRKITPLALNDDVGGIYIPDETDGLFIMQFTGLKDKNGKEIYEGDILKKCYGSSAPIGVVAYHDARASYIFQDGYNSPLFEVMPHVEIIGNIYENENLLNN